MITALVIFFITLLACRKKRVDGFTVYKIKMGKHSSGFHFGTRTSDTINFEARFDESAIYKSKDPINQADINKLYGFSDCDQHHQINSARFGWRWYNDELEIHAYVYNEGVRHTEYIGSVGLDEVHQYSLTTYDDMYHFSLDGKTLSMARSEGCKIGLYYKLFPYFGGDETAPHDITIQIKVGKKNR